MTAIKNLLHSATSLDGMTENQELITIRNNRAKRHLAASMSYKDVASKQEQDYYNKANGCSVKAQKDNLFDYSFWAENSKNL